MYKVNTPATLDDVAEFVLHQVKEHGLVDVKFTPSFEGHRTKPEDLLVWLNYNHHKSRKEKKKMKTSWRKENF